MIPIVIKTIKIVVQQYVHVHKQINVITKNKDLILDVIDKIQYPKMKIRQNILNHNVVFDIAFEKN
jgi:hypothetical protein